MSDQQPSEMGADSPRVEAQPQNSGSGMSGCAQAAIGVGIFALVMLCIGLAGVYWVVQNVRGIAANLVTPAIQSVVSEMEIPASQKKQISARIEQLGQDFKDNKIEVAQLEAILKGVVSSPIAGAAATIWFTDQYIEKSGLTEEEKKDATMTARRFAKGVLDKTISDQKANEVMEMISEPSPNNTTEFKKSLTDKELREIVLKMREAADAAGIESDVPEINFAVEFDKVVERTLKNGSTD